MSVERENSTASQDTAILSTDASDIEILEFLKKAPFFTHREMADSLQNIPSEQLERIAKYNPSTVYTIYDIILLRSPTNEDASEKYIMENMTFTPFGTPRTPYSKWSKDTLRFTSLNVKTAQKISAIIRGKHTEIKMHEIMDLLRRLEHMCTGEGFSMPEKSLALALLNIAALERTISPRYILHICCLMRSMRYPPAAGTLLKYFEKEDPSISELAVVDLVKEKNPSSEWCARVFLGLHIDRALSIFYKVKETLAEFIKEDDIDRAAGILSSIYLYSNDEKIEDTILTTFGENGALLLKKCEEYIWD